MIGETVCNRIKLDVINRFVKLPMRKANNQLIVQNLCIALYGNEYYEGIFETAEAEMRSCFKLDFMKALDQIKRNLTN